MKNLFKKTMLFAAAAMAFVSCENDTTDVNILPGIDVTVNATVEGTKSHFGDYNATDGTYPTLWDGTEKWAVCLNDTKVTAEDIEFANGNTAASATVTFSEPEAYNGTYTLFAVSPEARYVSVSMENDYIRFRVPGSQTPSITSCDPAAQVLIAQSEASETVSGFDVAFKHATAYGKFSFVNVAEGGTVTGVTIKSADVALAGRYVYAPSTKTISFKDEVIYEINLTTNTTTDLWFACGPAQVQGKKLTFIINTDKGKLEKEVTMPGNFVAGKVATFKIDMAGIDYPQVEGEQWQLVTNTADITAGEYLIAAKSLSGNVIYLPSTTTNSAPAQKIINISGLDLNSTAVFTTIQIPDDARFTFSGSASAMTITNADGNYLYLYNNNNGLRVGTTKGSWTIATNPNNSNALTFSMTATKTRYISVYKDQDWRSYDSIKPDAHDSNGASGSVFLYKKVAGGSEGGETPETPAPVLAVTSATTINVAAAGDVPTITYTITNPVGGQSVTATADQTWVNTFDCDTAGEISFVVDANTGSARTATVTISYTGAENKTVTINQAAAEQGGGDEPEQPTGGTHFVKVTSAPSDWSGTYLIVYEGGNVAFDGSRTTLDAVSNTQSVTIADGAIEATDAMKAIAFTINASGHIQSASGYYIGQTSNANGLKSSTSTKYDHTLSMSGTDVNMVSGGAYLRYNSNRDQTRFRYFKSGTYMSQKAIQLYKLN